MIGGEGPADPTWLVADTEIMVNAMKYKALVVLVEHRWAPGGEGRGDYVYVYVHVCVQYLYC